MSLIRGHVPSRGFFTEPENMYWTTENNGRVFKLAHLDDRNVNQPDMHFFNPMGWVLFRNTGSGVSITNPIDFVLPWFRRVTGIRTVGELLDSPYVEHKEVIEQFFTRRHSSFLNEDGTVSSRYRTVYNINNIRGVFLLNWLDLAAEENAQGTVLFYSILEYTVLEHELRTPQAQASAPVLWSTVRDYSTRMDPDEHNWYRYCKGEDPNGLMIGVEMEVDTSFSSQALQKVVQQDEPKQEPFFILKSDGSINRTKSYGYEIVTVPMTPKYFKTEMRKLFSKFNAEEKFTQENDSLGMHVHINKKSFANFRESEVKIGERTIKVTDTSNKHAQKFLMSFNPDSKGNLDLLQAISGRTTPIKDHRYCRPSMTGAGMRIAHRWKAVDKINDHQAACTLTNKGTIEVRVFQNWMNQTAVIKNVEFVEAVFDFTREYPISWFGPRFYANFKGWIVDQQRYRTLRNWMKKEGVI